MASCAVPACLNPGTKSPDADPADDASYIEAFPLESYGNWGKEMQELGEGIPNFSPDEAGKFYSHDPTIDTWYYFAYGEGSMFGFKSDGQPENKLASRLIGRSVRGDIAIVRSGPADADDYPTLFTKAELVKTAAFYLRNSPSQVFQERERSRASWKYGIPMPNQQSPQMKQAQAQMAELAAQHGFRMN